LCRATACHPSEIEEAIGELVAAGLVTGDGFAGLRGLLSGARRRADVQRFSRRALHQHPPAPGRWSLFLVGPELPPEEIREAWARSRPARACPPSPATASSCVTACPSRRSRAAT